MSSSDSESSDTSSDQELNPRKLAKSQAAATNESGDQEAAILRKKWVNRQRVLIFSSRGATAPQRHLMGDLRALMPHSKTDSKLDTKHNLPIINEIAEMKNCTKCLFFESRKRQDLYLWASNVEKGPSVKFLVHNIHTMGELKLSGNCLRGSRPILSFDETFDKKPYLQLVKELFVQVC